MTDRPAVPPAVSVVICTRNRAESLGRAVASVLADPRHDFELIVVDQSTDDATRDAIGPMSTDARLRYVRTDETGVSRSRNRALREAGAELVLSTDDDCEVPVGWIAANLAEFESNPEAAIVFGDVVAPDGVDNAFLPESIAASPFRVDSFRSWRFVDGVNVGIGAAMAMRRSPLLALGGFDEELGPGSRLRGGEDLDLAIRVLAAGHAIARSTEVRVVHHGGRTRDEFRTLIRSSMFSTGAVLGKLARHRPLVAGRLLVAISWRLVLRPAVESLARRQLPPVLGRATHLARGVWTGLRRPVDRSTWRFEPERD